MYFFVFYVVTQYLNDEKRIKIFEKIVLICVIWNVCICIWTITTLQHLPSAHNYGKAIFIPSGAFFNQNDLSSAFLLCCSILLFVKGKVGQITLLLVFFTMIVQGARLNLMILTPFFLYHFIFKTSRWYKLVVIATIILAISFVFIKFPATGALGKHYVTSRAGSFGTEVESQQIGSVRTRWRLYLISLEKFALTYGLGVGIGNFEYSTSPNRAIDTGGVLIPHNFFAEMLATEGIVSFTLICIIIFSPLLPIIRNERRKSILSLTDIKSLSENEKRVFVFLIFFFIAVAIPSSIRAHLIYWSMLGYNYSLIYNKNGVLA